ncbi:ribosome-releasing factor 2, mitochondrial [Bombyx mori]|uniref:Tr-type G domain-containing protein n=1 Tax=Bombyx mori TaxID=7091 RepID=A0A8R1WGH9_BOMMO|nr:ribosome-releasing factor 2, mitochondrial isoform X1 [Bombyx mori]XP_037876224.1 ribosome-releasing factor 2, mitochondrial isoform X1 [Bombyx mori]
MKKLYFLSNYRNFFKNAWAARCYSNSTKNNVNEMENIRNIGILAHIDAGKTTTTERMLFYSGTIRSMGEVHHGNTVTDYMEQERQRGITITSAAVTIPWRGGQINLIDTPGHIDFTMEVEQSLAVLDGAVIVLDGSAGVEAQTLTVWRQAIGYRVPRILYLNKMDRNDAFVEACVNSVTEKLQATPLLLHHTVRHEGRLIGLIDLINLEEIIWTQGRGQKFTRRKLTEKDDGHKWEAAVTDHRQLVDTLSSIDDEIAETIINNESLELSARDIDNAVRRSTIKMKAFPILCGSSYKNIGVQTLMDGVMSYLPSPLEGHELYKCFGEELAGRAFKVIHDDQRGVLTFVRLYSGEMKKAQKIYNLGQDRSEQTGALYVALADEYRPVESVAAGNIAVVGSLKATMTGDLVTSTQAAANRARGRLATLLRLPGRAEELMLPSARQRLQALDSEPEPEELAEILLGIGTTVPEPVFLCSIEPPSAMHQAALETALEQLQREDPSLRVNADDESGQIVLAGMGELHLEIIKERIIREYKIDVELGPLQIAYREALVSSGKNTLTVDRKIGGARQQLKVTMSARTVKGVAQDKILRLDKTVESASNLAHLHPRQLQAVRQGVAAALLHGPKLGCPVVDVQVTLHWFESGRGTSDSVVTASVAQCLRKVFEEADSILLEPVMSLEVVCPETHSQRVLADLSRRRVEVQHIQLRQHNKVIECIAPLSEVVGYSSTLRSLSSGLATFSMQFHSHRQMAPQHEQLAVKNVTGF